MSLLSCLGQLKRNNVCLCPLFYARQNMRRIPHCSFFSDTKAQAGLSIFKAPATISMYHLMAAPLQLFVQTAFSLKSAAGICNHVNPNNLSGILSQWDIISMAYCHGRTTNGASCTSYKFSACYKIAQSFGHKVKICLKFACSLYCEAHCITMLRCSLCCPLHSLPCMAMIFNCARQSTIISQMSIEN